MPRPAKPKPPKRAGPGRPPVGRNSERRRRFIEELIADPKLNGTQAAIRAGFSEKGAKQRACYLMKDPEIQEAIKAACEERSKRVKVDAEWVLERLQEIVERCMQHEEVKDREGNGTGEFVFNATGANKSLELLGKHLAMWTEKVEHAGPNGTPLVPVLNVTIGRTKPESSS